MMDDEMIDILVVDDLPANLIVLKSILEELGENIVTARSGAEALEQVLRHDFAVILLDVNMPGMDGFETASLVRKRRKTAHTPIIFITGFADELHTSQGYGLGAVDYILSPVAPEVLRTKVRVFCELQRMTRRASRQAEERVALAREQAARMAAEETNRRSAFLAEASITLASSLDHETTIRNLARLGVPFLADFSLVITAAAETTGDGEVAWVDGSGAIHAESRPAARNDLPECIRGAIGRALAGEKATILEDITGEDLGPASANRPPAASSAVVLPLRTPRRTLGVLLLARGPARRRFQPSDLAFAEDFAGRATTAIENARLYHDIQESDRRKNEFLSMLAHELRNPLAPIRNAVGIMRLRGSEAEECQWARDVIDRQVVQLTRLIDDLLDVSRITSGKVALKLETVSLATIITQAVEISRPLIDVHRHRLSVSLPDEPLHVRGDSTRLAQVLANLLNNAAKYTEDGGEIALEAGQDGNDAVLSVRDTGIGIPEAMLSSIFDLFTQADQGLERSQGGLGIGLTLVRNLVEMHQGNVQAYSNGPKEGSTFVVRLPLHAEAPALPRVSYGQPVHRSTARRRRVLVVDDNADAANSLARFLRLEDLEIKTAHDGRAALESARTFHPEVMLLDICLPGLDGYELARRVREQDGERDRELLLVALTGYGQEEDRRRSREAGFDFHLTKPVDLDLLLRILADSADSQVESDEAVSSPRIARPRSDRC